MVFSRIYGTIRGLRFLISFQRSMLKSLRAIIELLSTLANHADHTWRPKIKALLSGATINSKLTLQAKVEVAEHNTEGDPKTAIPKNKLRNFKDSLHGIFVMTNTVLPLISAIAEMAKTKSRLASNLGKKLNDLQTNITTITTAMDAMNILYGPEMPKLPATHPGAERVPSTLSARGFITVMVLFPLAVSCIHSADWSQRSIFMPQLNLFRLSLGQGPYTILMRERKEGARGRRPAEKGNAESMWDVVW